MSRWEGLPLSNGQPGPGPVADSVLGTTSNTFFAVTGSPGIAAKGDYIGYDVDGTSGFVKCYYYLQETLLCEENPGCCSGGCCPKDWIMMGGLYILLAFVIIFSVLAILSAIVCYSLSKSRQKKEQQQDMAYAYSQYGGSQVGVPLPYTNTYSPQPIYGSYIAPGSSYKY